MTTRHISILLGCLSLAAASARAQTNWTTQIEFRNRLAGVDGPLLPGNQMTLTATGVYTFTVRVGIFNLTGLEPGQANYGLNAWKASGIATGLGTGETLGVVQTNARVSPFVFGPREYSGLLYVPTGFENIRAMRDAGGGAAAPWLWDTIAQQPAPMPTLPNNPSPGADAFASVWRFQVQVNTLIGPDIAVTFTGQAGPMLRWSVFDATPPDASTPGEVHFLGHTPTPDLRDYAPVTLTLHRVPAPGIVVIVVAAAALACRRGRSINGRSER